MLFEIHSHFLKIYKTSLIPPPLLHPRLVELAVATFTTKTYRHTLKRSSVSATDECFFFVNGEPILAFAMSGGVLSCFADDPGCGAGKRVKRWQTTTTTGHAKSLAERVFQKLHENKGFFFASIVVKKGKNRNAKPTVLFLHCDLICLNEDPC